MHIDGIIMTKELYVGILNRFVAWLVVRTYTLVISFGRVMKR